MNTCLIFLDNFGVVQESIKRTPVQILADDGVNGLGLSVRSADLNQAQNRIISPLAHEFGIDGYECFIRKAIAEETERFGGGNQVHGRREARSPPQVNG